IRVSPVKVDPERAARRESFDHADIAERRARGIVLPITLRKGIAVPVEQRTCSQRIVAARQFLAELIDPGAHDRLDRALEAGAVRIDWLVRRERDDEVDANQLSFREERMEGAHVTSVGVGKIISDRLAHRAVIALTRDVNENRNIAT